MPRYRRSFDRRPVLRLTLAARAARSERLWRRVLVYYVRHADRVWRRDELRAAVRTELERSAATVTECLCRLPAEALEGYDQSLVARTLEIDARYPEIVEYVKLFEIADRIFAALDRSVAGYGRMRVDVSQALRNPAQVVADAGMVLNPIRTEEYASLHASDTRARSKAG